MTGIGVSEVFYMWHNYRLEFWENVVLSSLPKAPNQDLQLNLN
jgi:hypothetical protein